MKIKRVDGTFSVAMGATGIDPAIFANRKKAKEFADELKAHDLNASPVKASLTIQVQR